MANKFEQFTPLEVRTIERALRTSLHDTADERREAVDQQFYADTLSLYMEAKAQREAIEEEWKDKHYAG